MEIDDYLNSRGLTASEVIEGVRWCVLDPIEGEPRLGLGLAKGHHADSDVSLEMVRDEQHPVTDVPLLLEACNAWNNEHRLTRARLVQAGAENAMVVVVDAWLPATAGVMDEVIGGFIDGAIAEMLSFWNITPGPST